MRTPDEPQPASGPAISIPVAANTLAVGVVGSLALDANADREVPRKRVISWAFWDWATQPFNTVILSFIYTPLFLTTIAFLPPAIADLAEDDPLQVAALSELASGLGWGAFAAGLVIAIIAPVLGQRADAAGRQKPVLLLFTGLLIACMIGLGFIPAEPSLFWVAVGLVAFGTVFGEVAQVNYNAMLPSIATAKSVGRISGLGWGFGYIGGIVALVLVVVFYSADWFGLDASGGLPFQVIALGCAIWAIIFIIPLIVNVPDVGTVKPERQVSFFASYRLLVQDIKRLYREARTTFWFLLASAVFRDGLAGVFAFGAVIAAQVFGFEFLELVIFGIAANLIAGVSTIIAGRIDDRVGPRTVILSALGGLLVAGFVVFFARDGGQIVFWIFGLILCAFVGPAQAASRSFLARVTPAGREGEVFGLYATTGRAASWMSAGLWSLAIIIGGSTAWGILGIMVVLAAGFVLLLFVKLPKHVRVS